VVVAYSPTELADAFVKDAFHLLLFGCLKAMPLANKVVLLGDFNVELGGGWQSSNGVVGRHHLHHIDPSSHNGERLLDQATSFGLRVANTFFPHRPGHLST